MEATFHLLSQSVSGDMIPDLPVEGRWPSDGAIPVRTLTEDIILFFCSKILYSHSGSLRPGVLMGTGDFFAPSPLMLPKPEISAGLMGHLARMQFTCFPYIYLLRHHV